MLTEACRVIDVAWIFCSFSEDCLTMVRLVTVMFSHSLLMNMENNFKLFVNRCITLIDGQNLFSEVPTLADDQLCAF